MSDPKNPVPGDLVIDASDVAVVDITPEQIVKLIKLHEGAEKALANIERLKPSEIKRAGLNPTEVDRAITLIAEYRRTEALLPAAEKLVELLTETRFDRGHQISLILAEVATQARRRGERDPPGLEIHEPELRSPHHPRLGLILIIPEFERTDDPVRPFYRDRRVLPEIRDLLLPRSTASRRRGAPAPASAHRPPQHR